jgi:hypothetical protein
MLGFAIVDNQPSAERTAVWLTSHLGGSRVSHTNAVVIRHDDERHDTKIWNLTADRAIVLTSGSTPPIPFAHNITLELFDRLLDETIAYQQHIVGAVTEFAKRTKNKNFSGLAFSPIRPVFKPDDRDEPQYRALSAANYVRDAWTAWLATDEQRVRRTVNPRTGKPPWMMPDELGRPTLAEFPPELGGIVRPEPTVKPKWVA